MRRANDNYPTPEPLAKWITQKAINMHPYPSYELSFLEPGCGDSAPFARAAAKIGVNDAHALDLRSISENVSTLESCLYTYDNTDFLTQHHLKYDVIATNPPFSLALPFIERSLDFLYPVGIAAFLLRLGFLASLQRASLFSHRPPSKVVVLQRRPSFVGKGTDSSEYAVFFWVGEGLQALMDSPPTLSWYENPRKG
jgi:hypothetical protein